MKGPDQWIARCKTASCGSHRPIPPQIWRINKRVTTKDFPVPLIGEQPHNPAPDDCKPLFSGSRLSIHMIGNRIIATHGNSSPQIMMIKLGRGPQKAGPGTLCHGQLYLKQPTPQKDHLKYEEQKTGSACHDLTNLMHHKQMNPKTPSVSISLTKIDDI